ncbi:hypothetical protein B0H17DRAFT_1088099 [Mycena rosella]|uniref:Uncharacterized protein n=1 Tax=Mycena rosella TaxID=1033263 RepID=A0AAD7CXI5_MYCRO|nr:hypothetical protein B0H17DRAFT_1088099 [Mycena rosella]
MTTMISPSNALPHSQRLRLIRSMRKLGDLLTETALLVEPAQSPVQDGSQPFLSLPIPTSSPFRRQFFSLRLPKTNASDNTPVTSPLSATFSVALNSPSTPVIDVEALHERKLAKVAQTLGENVPPELVFPRSARNGRKRSSTVSVPEPRVPGPPVVARRRHARGASRTIKHSASSTSLRVPMPVFDHEPFSYSTLVPIPTADCTPSPTTPTARVSSPPTREKARGMHRKEAGWSGEWSGSVQNMDDVVRGLRDLRFK